MVFEERATTEKTMEKIHNLVFEEVIAAAEEYFASQ